MRSQVFCAQLNSTAIPFCNLTDITLYWHPNFQNSVLEYLVSGSPVYVLLLLIITQHRNSDIMVSCLMFWYAECIVPWHSITQHSNMLLLSVIIMFWYAECILPSHSITHHNNMLLLSVIVMFWYAECILPSHNILQHNYSEITLNYRDILMYIRYEYFTIAYNTRQ
jgi:hypothetical protein